MRKYQYLVLPECYEAIYAFYYHVALKYRHTYSEEMMQQNIDDAADAFYRIENGLLRILFCQGGRKKVTSWLTPISGTTPTR